MSFSLPLVIGRYLSSCPLSHIVVKFVWKGGDFVIENELTKDAQYLLGALYKQYIDKRKTGINKSDAKLIGSSFDIHSGIMKKWSLEDVEETCQELIRSNFVYCNRADGISYFMSLSDKAIIYMENRFSNNAKAFLDWFSKITSSIPFL